MIFGESNNEQVQPDAIVHLGAGLCSELDDYLVSGSKRVMLVEPNPDIVRALRRRTERLDNVEVVASAVAPTDGTASLKVYNFPAFSSLRAPSGLRNLFPGLRLSKEVMVETVKATRLIDTSGLDRRQCNWLIVDAPGEEHAILDELARHGQLDLFEILVLHCGVTPLFEGGVRSVQLLQELAEHGYEVVRRDEEPDPDRPRWVLRKNKVVMRIIALQSQLKAAEKLHSEQNAHHQQEMERSNKERSDLASALTECRKLLSESRLESDALKQLAEDRLTRISQLESMLAEMNWKRSLVIEEFLKTEAQLELIKDVILRSPSS